MTDATAHSELVARLEGASEGSRETDREMTGLFYRMGERFIGIECDCCPDGRHVTPVWIDPQTDEWKTTALDGFEFTTSIDAALALAERVRVAPYTGPITLTIAGSGQAYIDHIDPCGMGVQAFGNTPALALCIAVLKATATQPSDDGEKT